ncbi:MAG: cell wall-binding repeat-containing protein [Gracilibacteraceae bacterium]|jgi:hypothetical protein|nr:cell wall-binding repeat-containing protein [Gracilibacteraceae bacterium]
MKKTRRIALALAALMFWFIVFPVFGFDGFSIGGAAGIKGSDRNPDGTYVKGTKEEPYKVRFDTGGLPYALYDSRHDTAAIPSYGKILAPENSNARGAYFFALDTTPVTLGYVTDYFGKTLKVYVVGSDTLSTVYYDVSFTYSSGGGASGRGGGGSGGELGRALQASDVTSYIGGANRVLTSIAISQQGWQNAASVILAPADANHLIDALTVSSLAGQEDIPVLLVSNRTVGEETFAEIQRLGAAKVYSIGWLGQTVADQVSARLPGVAAEIVQGKDRVETAKLIEAKITAPKGTFVVGYEALADAVSAASYAAANRWVIQVAAPDGSFAGGTQLSGYILGGPSLVRDISGLNRIYGADRYATNIALFNALNYQYEYLYITDGKTLADGLSGAPLAGKTGAFILLAPNNDPTGITLPKITDKTKIIGLGAKK